MVCDLRAEDLGLTDGHDNEPLDVLDLPQLYTKPTAAALLSTLSDLRSEPSSWDLTPVSGNSGNVSGSSTPHTHRRKIRNEGVPAYLTRIVSSALQWIHDDQEKEQIWQNAAQELSIRSGRTAQGDLTRTFRIPLQAQDVSVQDCMPIDSVEFTLFEPALTADNLGLKTWASSFMLAKRLCLLKHLIKADEILELGSGTGLVGMAAACVFGARVVATDLPEIVPNLERNVLANASALKDAGGSVTAAVLDWTAPALLDVNGNSTPAQSFAVIVAADVAYSMDHPQMLATTINHHLSKTPDARLIIECPMRRGHSKDIELLRKELMAIDLLISLEGEETGYDDWSNHDEPLEVECWWSIWRWQR